MTKKNSAIAIKLRPKAERAIRKKHPWIFEDAIEKQSREGREGEVAIIFDRKSNRLIAAGLFDPYSTIRIRILSFGKGLHMGRDFLSQRLKKALAVRSELLSTQTTAFRWIYGENDGLPGLIIDVYKEVAVLKSYSAIWLPYLVELSEAIRGILPIQTIVFRLSRNVASLPIVNVYEAFDGKILYGEEDFDGELLFEEHGMKLSTNVIDGHKTGFFLDHRHNRLNIRELAKGRDVLDVFSYSGGFSVSALMGGARSVTAVDISKRALAHAQFNAKLNGYDGLKTLLGDAFEILEKMNQESRQFDLIIVDPPSFAKRLSETPQAQKAYQRLFDLVMPLCRINGILLLASCSSRVSPDDFEDLLIAATKRDRRKWRIFDHTRHDTDHPLGIKELNYLKAVYLERLE